jgi:hypothetical protein
MHCKRHGHILPREAKGWNDRDGKRKNKRYKVNDEKASKDTAPTIIYIPYPVYVATPVVERIERSILPKETVTCSVTPGISTRATQTIEAGCTGSPSKHHRSQRQYTHKSQAGTQTEKRNKSSSSQCHSVRTVRRRTRSISSQIQRETQTHESVLSSVKEMPTVRTTSTHVCSQLFSMSSSPIGSSVEGEMVESWFTNPSNEMSVQTEESPLSFSEFSTIETQTMCTGGGTESFLNSEDDLLSFMQLNDTETQTQWNNDGTTQTDNTTTDFSNFVDFGILD